MAPTLTLQELTNPLTRQEVQASIYTVLARVGVNTTSWRSGAVVRTTIVGVSVVIAALTRLQADIARSGFLELAEGQWLRLCARHGYNVEVQEATFATGELELRNTAGGLWEFDPGELVVANTVTGKTYRNLEAVTLAALETKAITIIATEAGSASSAEPLQITTLVTPSLLTGVEFDNPLRITGQDEERPATTRLRCSEKLGSLSPMGPWDAYAYAVRNAKRADGESVGVSRIKITKDGYGNVFVYCATPDGAVQLSDMQVLTEAVYLKAEPQAVTSHVISATARAVNVTAELWAYNTIGMTEQEVQDAGTAKLRAYFSAQPVGGARIGSAAGKVFHDATRAAISGTAPEHIFHVELSGGDTTLTVDEVPVLGVVSLTVHFEPPPEGYNV